MNSIFDIPKLQDITRSITDEMITASNELKTYSDDARVVKLLSKEIELLQKTSAMLNKIVDIKAKLVADDKDSEKKVSFRTRS